MALPKLSTSRARAVVAVVGFMIDAPPVGLTVTVSDITRENSAHV
jgi:hypothetical protein